MHKPRGRRPTLTSTTRPYRSHPYSQPPTSRRCAPALALHAPCAPRSLRYANPRLRPASPQTQRARNAAVTAPCATPTHASALPHLRHPRLGRQLPMPHRSLLAAAGTRPYRSPPNSQPPTSWLCAAALALHAPCDPRSLRYPKPSVRLHRRRPRLGRALPMPQQANQDASRTQRCSHRALRYHFAPRLRPPTPQTPASWPRTPNAATSKPGRIAHATLQSRRAALPLRPTPTVRHSQPRPRLNPATPPPAPRQARSAPTPQTTSPTGVATARALIPQPCAGRRLRQPHPHHNAQRPNRRPSQWPPQARKTKQETRSPTTPSIRQKQKEARPARPAAPHPIAKY